MEEYYLVVLVSAPISSIPLLSFSFRRDPNVHTHRESYVQVHKSVHTDCSNSLQKKLYPWILGSE
ncbi:uncharacterized protein BDW43DRAFT_286390 [Aspergillus alliaceus]|uniref:uncharacterized protein n=1 Tax=Petromyces alliaceus TaxID=209559 RepID=UPI0012A53C01|nr:uncharacterized protein BDW43DRAFT_286390 [Aspergillus alliaceus]KAB8230177.1 hypothetical protein BDW43DRAFT_286390 [Aspergillus alliaceus]